MYLIIRTGLWCGNGFGRLTMRVVGCVICLLTLNINCVNHSEMKGSINSVDFGTLPDGKVVRIYTLTNANGMEVKVINYGGIITSVSVPDRNNEMTNITLGLDSLSHYLKGHPYFGALVGRFANRIGDAKFELDGKEYNLTKNSGDLQIHGGFKGYDKVFWEIEELEREDGVGLKLTYMSPDGEEGFPGNVSNTIYYLLGDDNTLTFEYKAVSDKPTIINLTQHAYFNLAGEGDVLDHELQLFASKFLPIDTNHLPTGELRDVEGGPFDFRNYKKIGRDIDADNLQLERGSGYDHFWVFDDSSDGHKPFLAARLKHEPSGRIMEVYTTEPGTQIYTANFLNGSLVGNNGIRYNKRGGVCIETGHFPDAPNHSTFPSTVLLPGEEYYSKTILKFMTE